MINSGYQEYDIILISDGDYTCMMHTLFLVTVP